MKYICVQPRTTFFAWQLEVMLTNFLENKIASKDVHILISYKPNDPDTCNEKVVKEFDLLKEKFAEVQFFLYEDTRVDTIYAPSIYFNTIKQHYLKYPALSKQAVFCHDCDMLFTKKLDLKGMLKDDIWYLSNTNEYINSDYILSKGQQVYDDMCSIVGIDPKVPIANKEHSGGAQYLIKKATYEFWNKVEQDSIKLYRHFAATEPQYKLKFEGDFPIQKWTAGMWALLWNAWLFGFETKVDPRLDFCWATDPIRRWKHVSIFHNAGVGIERKLKLFCKIDYKNRTPIGKVFEHMDERYCAYNYSKIITQLTRSSPDFIGQK